MKKSKNCENKIFLPRGYLSWSQMCLWKQSKEKYRQKYYFGEKERGNKYFDYGKEVAEALEGAKLSDKGFEGLKMLLPSYKHREHEIKAILAKTPLLGKMDTFEPKTKSFREYKTGKNGWTQNKAKKHGQLKFYALLIWLKYKKLPKEIWLDWIETKEEDGELDYTGKIKSFKVDIKLEDLLSFMAEIKKITLEISEDYKNKINNL